MKKDLDACVKSFSKLRGRRLQTQELATQFDSLLRETFPEIFPSVEEEVIEMSSNRKRSRTEETPEVVEAPEKKRPTKKEEITGKLTAEEKVRATNPFCFACYQQSFLLNRVNSNKLSIVSARIL